MTWIERTAYSQFKRWWGDARLRPREREQAVVRFGARLATVLDAERPARRAA